MTLEILIEGPPVPYKRVGLAAKVPVREKRYRTHVRSCAHVTMLKNRRERFLGPLRLELQVYCPTRQLGDCSNYAKSVEDAFNGVVWVDDVQVVDLHVTRNLDRKRPRVIASVTPLDWPGDEDLPAKAQRSYSDAPKRPGRNPRRA